MTRVSKDTNTGLIATEIGCIEFSDVMLLESFTFKQNFVLRKVLHLFLFMYAMIYCALSLQLHECKTA